jgi:hypothetical protein
MNRYLFLCRIKWPVMIVVFGITALLDQWNILSFGESWPLYLIAWGLMQLAERAAWSQAYADTYAGQTYAGRPGNWGGPAGPSAPPPPSSTALTITPPDEGRR